MLPQISLTVGNDKLVSTANSPLSRANSETSNSTASSLPTVGRSTTNNSNLSVISLLGSDKGSVSAGIAGLTIDDSDGDDSVCSSGSYDSSVSSVESCLPEKISKSVKCKSSYVLTKKNSKHPLPATPKSLLPDGKAISGGKLIKDLSPQHKSAMPRNYSSPELSGSPKMAIKKQIHDDLSHNCHHVLLSKPMTAVPHIHITVNAKDANVIASHARVPVQHGALPVVQRKGTLSHPGGIQHQQYPPAGAGAISPSAHRLLSSGVPDELIDSVESLVNAQYYAGVPHFAQATVGSLLGIRSPRGGQQSPHGHSAPCAKKATVF